MSDGLDEKPAHGAGGDSTPEAAIEPDPGPTVLAAGEELLLGELALAEGAPHPRREHVEPYLAALLQAEHLNLLCGAGLTSGLAHLAGAQQTDVMASPLELDDSALAQRLEDVARASAERIGRGVPNIEDRLRTAIAAGEGLQIAGDPRAPAVRAAVDAALRTLRAGVAQSERALADGLETTVAGTTTVAGLLATFLTSFAGRPPTRDRLHIFTTNYDRVVEWGAELAGLRLLDRFVGTLEPVFRSSRLEVDFHYSPPGGIRDPRHLDGVVRLTKLHGSLDWRWDSARRQVRRIPVPFGSEPTDPADANSLLVFPNDAKDIDTNFHPYADLFRDFSASVCRPQSVLVTYGYSFGDSHINRVIQDMLTIPSTHLLIVAYDDRGNRVRNFVADHTRAGQVSLMLGPLFAGLDELVAKWLPWPSAEFVLQRRAELSRGRATVTPAPASAGPPTE